MWFVMKVFRISAGDITNLHYNFVVAKPLVIIIVFSIILVYFGQVSNEY